MSARVDVNLAGASSANTTRVVLTNRSGQAILKSGVVLHATDAIVGQTRLEWIDNDRLQILLCEPGEYRVRSKVQRAPLFRQDGSDNSLRVEILSQVYSTKTRTCQSR
jgi:hypothetical protein